MYSVILDALSQCADLITIIMVDSDLLLQIHSLQEVATGELWLQLKYFTDHRAAYTIQLVVSI